MIIRVCSLHNFDHFQVVIQYRHRRASVKSGRTRARVYWKTARARLIVDILLKFSLLRIIFFSLFNVVAAFVAFIWPGISRAF